MESTEMLTVDETKRELKLGRSSVYELINAGKIPVVRFGRAVRVPRASLARYVESLTAAAEQRAGGVAA